MGACGQGNGQLHNLVASHHRNLLEEHAPFPDEEERLLSRIHADPRHHGGVTVFVFHRSQRGWPQHRAGGRYCGCFQGPRTPQPNAMTGWPLLNSKHALPLLNWTLSPDLMTPLPPSVR
jgi:hypothetical protein